MGYSYNNYNGIPPVVMEGMEDFGIAILVVAAVFAVIALAVAAVVYVFGSLGLYTIAKRRGIHNAWLAWIPVASFWIEGSISDQYQYVVRRNIRSKRKLLLGLGIAAMVISGAVQVSAGAVVSGLIMNGSQDGALAGGMVGVLTGLLTSGLNIALLVFHYMAMYDLYTSCSPQNNVLFLVLSIVFQITEPFFLFFNRNKDDGMPPRRVTCQAPEPPMQEQWNNPEM